MESKGEERREKKRKGEKTNEGRRKEERRRKREGIEREGEEKKGRKGGEGSSKEWPSAMNVAELPSLLPSHSDLGLLVLGPPKKQAIATDSAHRCSAVVSTLSSFSFIFPHFFATSFASYWFNRLERILLQQERRLESLTKSFLCLPR